MRAEGETNETTPRVLRVDSLGVHDARWDESTRIALLALRDSHASIVPNTHPDRVIATASALRGGCTPLFVLSGPEDEPTGAVVARLQRRPIELRLGFRTLSGPRVTTCDIVRSGVLGATDQLLAAWSAIARQAGIARTVWHALPSDVMTPRGWTDGEGDPRFGLDMTGAEDPLSHRGSKSRSKVRRYARKIEQDIPGLRIESLTEPERVEEFCKACEAISAHSYHEQIGYGVRDNTLWRSIIGCEAEAGRWRAWLMTCDDGPLAYQNGTVHQNIYYSEGKGFDRRYSDHRPGTALLYTLLTELLRDGLTVVDFGVGESDYKTLFGNVKTSERKLVSFGSGVAGLLARAADGGSRFLGSIAGQLSKSTLGRGIRKRAVRSAKKSDVPKGATNAQS